MVKFHLRGISEHAEEWRDPDPAGKEDSRPCRVVMQAEGAHRPFNCRRAAHRQLGYGLLVNRISDAGCHYELFVGWGACNGESMSQSGRRPKLGLRTR